MRPRFLDGRVLTAKAKNRFDSGLSHFVFD